MPLCPIRSTVQYIVNLIWGANVCEIWFVYMAQTGFGAWDFYEWMRVATAAAIVCFPMAICGYYVEVAAAVVVAFAICFATDTRYNTPDTRVAWKRQSGRIRCGNVHRYWCWILVLVSKVTAWANNEHGTTRRRCIASQPVSRGQCLNHSPMALELLSRATVGHSSLIKFTEAKQLCLPAHLFCRV